MKKIRTQLFYGGQCFFIIRKIDSSRARKNPKLFIVNFHFLIFVKVWLSNFS